ncbi:helix-turn-helix domain-containing protein [Nocardiopsis dassonvillei]|jgi:DNA-binding transcriptional regulator YiaG
MNLLREVRVSRRLPLPEEARAIRERAGVSQTRLAEELGVHRITVGRWESGTREPRGALRAAYTRLLLRLVAEVGE